MELGPKLAEGKTKIIYAHPGDDALAIMIHKDGITAGDGARRNVIAGKGALSGRTASNVFALLNRAGIATHFVDAPEPTVMVVRRCQMIPVEVVMRRVATGSYLKRNADVAEGSRFDPPLVEFFLKDDARHDPQISPADMQIMGLASAAEIEQITHEGVKVFETLEHAWAAQGVMLVDLKIEFGRAEGSGFRVQGSGIEPAIQNLLVADMIDNDSWRLWPGGEKAHMLDKQVYRNMTAVTDDGLAQVRQLYQTVADMTDVWR